MSGEAVPLLFKVVSPMVFNKCVLSEQVNPLKTIDCWLDLQNCSEKLGEKPGQVRLGLLVSKCSSNQKRIEMNTLYRCIRYCIGNQMYGGLKYNGGSNVVYTMEALPTLFSMVLQKISTLLSSSLFHSQGLVRASLLVLVSPLSSFV